MISDNRKTLYVTNKFNKSLKRDKLTIVLIDRLTIVLKKFFWFGLADGASSVQHGPRPQAN